KSSGLGMRNLERVMGMLMDVAERPGQDYELLGELYDNVVAQWGRYNGHVAAIVGGARTQEKYGTGARFEPMPEAKQREALRYLNANAFRVPAFMLDRDVLFRIEAEGQIRRIRMAQAGVLNALFNENRLNRLIEYEALAARPTDAYTIAELLDDLRSGVWTELTSGSVRIDVHRRNLQRAYLEAIDRTLNPPPPPTNLPPGFPQPPARFQSDVRPTLRGHLQELDRAIANAIPRAADGMTRLHLRDLRMEIERLLDPTG
ncbi:MAG TPA: zinc-dependent metalloprotease, partial [Gemmatimonadaceae bacterium]|nr:zinc-dependent metalloprotease [Gemmatimonadaceae bacterium]